MVKRKLRYVVFRTTSKTRELVLHSEHFTKKAAEERRKRDSRTMPSRRPFIVRKLKPFLMVGFGRRRRRKRKK